MPELTESQILPLIGEDGFARLIAAFYRRVPGDPILGPMYKQQGDLAAAEQRLRDFVIQRFGGPDRYSQARGHPRLRLRHMPFPVDPAARDQWIMLMEQALAEVNFTPEVTAILRAYFQDTATFLINRPASKLRIVGNATGPPET
jgi:hemoglobin